MFPVSQTISIAALLLCGCHFGVFYAWICTTMWGLDAADPRVAIQAMQAMNASVRNAAFAPVFFGAPIALLGAAGVFYLGQLRLAALLFALAGLLVLFGSVFLTMSVNVPMNADLATVDVPDDIGAAAAIWQAYSPDWQFWNQMRTLASGLGFVLALIGLTLARTR